MNLLWPLQETRRIAYSTIVGVWMIVAIYAVLHDQYLVRISPEHFTEYHPQIWGIQDPHLLAAALAFNASFGPGLLLGVACLFAARAGSFPKPPIQSVLLGVVAVIAATELVSASLGYYVHRTQQPLYPLWCYPDTSLPLLVTQTIQISCYLASALFSGVLLVKIMVARYRRARRMAAE